MAIVAPIRKLNRTRVNLLLDTALALTFVAELQYHFVGLSNHELMGVGLGAALLIHVILHWQWIVGLTKTFFHNLLHGSRLNYVLNFALFADLAVVIITGILISRTLGLSLGIEGQSGHTWEQIHILAANLSLLLVGLHVAVHWKWIAAHAKKYLFSFRLPVRKAAPTNVSVIVPSSEV